MPLSILMGLICWPGTAAFLKLGMLSLYIHQKSCIKLGAKSDSWCIFNVIVFLCFIAMLLLDPFGCWLLLFFFEITLFVCLLFFFEPLFYSLWYVFPHSSWLWTTCPFLNSGVLLFICLISYCLCQQEPSDKYITLNSTIALSNYLIIIIY